MREGSAPSFPSRPPKPPRVPVAAATGSFAAELAEWKRRRGLPGEAKVFSMTGAFPGIRKALVARGWVENEDKGSPLWNFKYALWQRDIGELGELDETQVVNYFARNSELTSKVGLCNSLYNCCTLDRVDVDSFYPRCYDLTSGVQVESFIEDFKVTKCLCILRRFVADGGRTAEGQSGQGFPQIVIANALNVCQRRAQDIDDNLDEALTPPVQEKEWQVLTAWSLKTPGKRLKGKAHSGGQPLQAAGLTTPAAVDPKPSEDDAAASDGSEDEEGHHANSCSDGRSAEEQELYARAQDVLETLRHRLPQFYLDGCQNIWVLKPAGKSRGRGIQLSASLEKILEVGVGRGAEARWIAQKYIEHPLIISGKKFDIRQWVVVTRWNPLSVWFYLDCYVRFSFQDYDPQRIKNKYGHLTNFSVSKHADDFDEHRDETMWHSDDLQAHLKGLHPLWEGRALEDPWLEVVQPQMKKVVLRTLESAQDAVLPRASSFELFGYDFMIGEDLSVWLLEINSSPDLSYSTETTKTLVKAMLEDMVQVVVDVEKFGHRLERPKRKWGSCRCASGRFELLEPARRRKEEKFRRLRKDAAQLAVQGRPVKLRKPRKGECPRGPDAEDDPSHSAVALLAAAGEGAERPVGETEEEDDEQDEEEERDEENDPAAPNTF